ncbi:PTCHD2, partial [Symbiodinium pilosum]
VGSALTTIGSASFLLPCTMHVFFKLGAVVCGVTTYAVVFALVPLPAVLMCFGPCGHDFRSILELLGRAAQNIMPEDEEEEDDEDQVLSVAPTDEVREHRRYVLNMPSKGMGQVGDTSHFQPTRTRIAIHG